jgi:hypothetical protein
MDYKNIHDNIINRAKKRKLVGYSENHHIIPKCMGGTNDKENLVKLTAKEHWLIHLLLIEIYPKNQKLKVAIFKMMQSSSNQNRQQITGKQFQRLRLIAAEAQGNLLRGKKRKPFSEEHKKNISKGKSGKVSNRKGVKLSNETKKKIGISSVGRIDGDKNPMKRQDVLAWFKDNNPMKREDVLELFKGDKNPNAKKVKVLSTNKIYTTIKECIEDLKISRTQFRRLVAKKLIIYESDMYI